MLPVFRFLSRCYCNTRSTKYYNNCFTWNKIVSSSLSSPTSIWLNFMFASGMRPTFWTYVLVLALLSKICKLENFTFQNVTSSKCKGLPGPRRRHFTIWGISQGTESFLACLFFSVEFAWWWLHSWGHNLFATTFIAYNKMFHSMKMYFN